MSQNTLEKKSAERQGYTQFIGKVRVGQKAGIGMTVAVTRAVKDCMGEGISRPMEDKR